MAGPVTLPATELTSEGKPYNYTSAASSLFQHGQKPAGLSKRASKAKSLLGGLTDELFGRGEKKRRGGGADDEYAYDHMHRRSFVDGYGQAPAERMAAMLREVHEPLVAELSVSLAAAVNVYPRVHRQALRHWHRHCYTHGECAHGHGHNYARCYWPRPSLHNYTLFLQLLCARLPARVHALLKRYMLAKRAIEELATAREVVTLLQEHAELEQEVSAFAEIRSVCVFACVRASVCV